MRSLFTLVTILFFSHSVLAGDILPYHMKIKQGNIQTSTEQDLTAIDNQALYLQPSKKGQFNSSFYFKKKDLKGSPFLDIRISFSEGNYEFQIKKGKTWTSLGTIQAKKGWQRVKLDLANGLEGYGSKIQVRILGHDKPSSAQLDYLGFSIGAETALYQQGYQ